MQSLSIRYDNPTAVYSPGNPVSGTVEIKLEKKLKVEAIMLELHGEARTHFTRSEQKWRTDKKGRQESYREGVPYDQRITYAEESLLLWTPAGGSKYMAEGTHCLPFSFVLPMKCAPSYEGTYGYIRYYCKAKMDIPWNFDKKSKAPFTVMPLYDLNLIPNASSSALEEVTENIGFSLLRHGYVTLRASLPKRGYVPGEPLTVTIYIANGSTKVFQKVALKLKQFLSYTANNAATGKRGTMDEERTAYEMEKDLGLEAHHTKVYHVTAQVPLIPPTFNDSLLVSVKYELQVKIFPKSKLNTCPKVTLPIIIGTVPVGYTQNPMPIVPIPVPTTPVSPMPVPAMPAAVSMDSMNSMNSVNRTSQIPSAPPMEPEQNLPPPPSYEECVFPRGALHEESLAGYSPMYPALKA